jgi:tetratricopeptide (TPR) repeat protein
MGKKEDRANELNQEGLAYYEAWEIEKAVDAFEKAIKNDPKSPDYRLNLTRAFTRSGDYDKAMEALGGYLQVETDPVLSARFEKLFSSGLDDVEQRLIDGMKKLSLPIQQIGKAIQMWLEFRITIGRKPLPTPKPELWAAGLTYAIIKINFAELTRAEVSAVYDVSPRALKEKYDELVDTLDLMPSDYRYFTGEENPLDKLVEAAELLEGLERKFRED